MAEAELDPATLDPAVAPIVDDQDNTPTADTSSPEAVKVAELMGWKPLDKWKGDPSTWRKAEDFLAEVPEIMRNTRKTSERVQGRLDRVTAEVAKLTKTQRQQIDVDLDRALEVAVEAGDMDAVRKITARLRQPVDAAPDEAPAFTAFKERNEWFEVDDAATAYVIALDKQLDKNGSAKANPEAHMKKIEAAVKEAFPKLFGEARSASRVPLVGRGGRGDPPKPSGDLTPADLSQQQRKAADEMGVSHKDYVASLNKINAKEKARA